MNIRKFPIISILLFCFASVHGQRPNNDLDTIVRNYVIGLNSKGVDTLCIYQEYCVGCYYLRLKDEDKCDLESRYNPVYLFWSDKGQTFLTKKDNCFDYPTIKIENDSVWHFFFQSLDTLAKEEIKIPQIIEVKNKRQDTVSVIRDHSTHQSIQVIVGQTTILNKDLDDFYFSKEIESEQQKNINYDYNIHSHLKNFQLIIFRIVNKAIQENKLTKENKNAASAKRAAKVNPR